jgi:cell division protease FtsH
MLAHADPVRKVSIVARGMMGGYTRVVPDEDRLFKTKAQFEDELAVYMAGHVAEDMVFEEQSTGAANDIERATGLARRMVTEFGMSRTLGPRAFGKKDELIFLGREINEQRNYSDEVAYQIDQEIQELIDAAHERARVIVEGNADKLQTIADLLLERETIEGEELEALFETPRPRPDLVGPPSGRPGRGVEPGTPAAEQPAARGERDLPPSPGQLRPQPAD